MPTCSSCTVSNRTLTVARSICFNGSKIAVTISSKPPGKENLPPRTVVVEPEEFIRLADEVLPKAVNHEPYDVQKLRQRIVDLNSKLWAANEAIKRSEEELSTVQADYKELEEEAARAHKDNIKTASALGTTKLALRATENACADLRRERDALKKELQGLQSTPDPYEREQQGLAIARSRLENDLLREEINRTKRKWEFCWKTRDLFLESFPLLIGMTIGFGIPAIVTLVWICLHYNAK